jgi:hypothetical protein
MGNAKALRKRKRKRNTGSPERWTERCWSLTVVARLLLVGWETLRDLFGWP